MKDWDDKIHRALDHPTRRRIVECLHERSELSFAELMRSVAVRDHGKLGFHLRVLKELVEHEPSTKKYRLTERGQLASELIWDTRFLISKSGQELMLEPARYVRRLRLGDHAVLFYDTEELERGVSFPFLLTGLLKGEAVVYLVSEDKLDSETREIIWYGISIDFFRSKAFTIMSAEEWYLNRGKGQTEVIKENWLRLLKEKQMAGYIGMHVAGEMEAFFRNGRTEELLRYEAILGRQLPPNFCGLCLYNKNSLVEEKQFTQLNKLHGHSIFKGMALRTT